MRVQPGQSPTRAAFQQQPLPLLFRNLAMQSPSVNPFKGNRVEKLRAIAPEDRRRAFTKGVYEQGRAVGLAAPTSTPGLSKHLAQQAELLSGEAAAVGVPNPPGSIGAIQEASQRSKGLGLLADFDKARNANNTDLQRRIALFVSRLPKSHPLSQYASRLLSATNPATVF